MISWGFELLSENYFYTKDILNRNVKLTTTQLHTHILGKGGHTEMAFDPKSISKTVEDPDYIYESKSNDQRDLYFGLGCHKIFKKMYVKVVVDYTNISEGNVITSYISETVSGDLGRIKYEKSTTI